MGGGTGIMSKEKPSEQEQKKKTAFNRKVKKKHFWEAKRDACPLPNKNFAAV